MAKMARVDLSDEDGALAGGLIAVGAACVAVGVGCLLGAGWGWLLFGAASVALGLAGAAGAASSREAP